MVKNVEKNLDLEILNFGKCFGGLLSAVLEAKVCFPCFFLFVAHV